MRITHKSGIRGELRNLDTGRIIPKAIWFDQDLGEYEAFKVGPDGEIAWEDGKPLKYTGKARLFFQPIPTLPQTPRPLPEPPKTFQRRKRIPVPMFSDFCDECDRVAAWMVSDEVPLPPIIGRNGRKYARAKVVATRYYCSWCYKPPRILDEKGEVMEEIDEIKVRPS